VEDLLTPPRSNLHLHIRLHDATIAGVRRTLASPEGYKHVMDGRPSDPTLLLQVFEGTERRFEGPVKAGQTLRFAGGQVTVAPEILLWANLQLVWDPFVELFLVGGLLLATGGLGALANLFASLVRRRAS
jgi:hypothetical protein